MDFTVTHDLRLALSLGINQTSNEDTQKKINEFLERTDIHETRDKSTYTKIGVLKPHEFLYLWFLVHEQHLNISITTYEINMKHFQHRSELREEIDDVWFDDICSIYEHNQSASSDNHTTIKNAYLKSQILYHIQEGHRVFTCPPVYIKESFHFGQAIGRGLYSLIPFLKGQCITQFTGSIHLHSKNSNCGKRRKRFETGHPMKQDYCYLMSYKGNKYIVNPLTKELEPDINNPSGFINEPSPPPFKSGDEILYTFPGIYATEADFDSEIETAIQQKAKVVDFDFKTGLYTIQIDDKVLEVLPERLSFCDKHIRRDYRANCVWFDFPIPIEFYEIQDGKFIMKKETFADVIYSKTEILLNFHTMTDEIGAHAYTHGMFVHLKVDTVMCLRENIFDGLYRSGVIKEVRSSHITVRHFMNLTECWRLPNQIEAGKYYSKYIPFPLIYACDDIAENDELLILYESDPIQTRGLPCRALVDNVMDTNLLKHTWDFMCT